MANTTLLMGESDNVVCVAMKTVAVMFLNGGHASTAIQALEIFRSAGVLWNILNGEPPERHFEVTTASSDGKPVRIDSHLQIVPEHAFAEIERPDLVLVTAGGTEFEEMVLNGYDIDEVIERNRDAIDWLKRWHAEGVNIAAVCSGVALLAATGLLDGKRATAHWGLTGLYRQRFPAIEWREEYLVIDNGDLYCGGGVNAAADLALYLVEKFSGHEIAVRCARALLIEMPRTWQNSFTHFALRATHDDEPILRAQDWLRAHFVEDVNLDQLAREVGMSPRNFARRFKDATGDTPLTYLQRLRIAIARHMLETTTVTVQEAAEQVGYADPIFFRNLFRRHTGLCPNDYRRRFGRRDRAHAVPEATNNRGTRARAA